MNILKILYPAMIFSLITVGCSKDNNEGILPNNPNDPESDPDPVNPSTYTQGTRVDVIVLDYSPAPGQFVNEIPEYETGDSQDDINAKVTESLCNGDLITLGAWGGSVTLKLEQPIENIPGKDDLRVVGNAIYSTSSISGTRYGSAEPGIVLVMKDENGNGLPDDTWYELKGDQTFNGISDYSVTYYQPQPDATDEQYILWIADNGDTGYINRVSSYHTQPFFPQWKEDVDSLTFVGRRLPDNGYFNTSTNLYNLMCYDGYADSHPNTTDLSCLDIDNAIDSNGNSVSLTAIDFIKIYTGVLQINGMLGECSTEVAAIERLDN